MLPITMMFASFFAIMFVALSVAVIQKRRALKIGTGTGDNKIMEFAVRAHGNFAEFVPFALILLAGAELNGAAGYVIILLGLLLAAGRLAHAYAFLMAKPEQHFKFRVAGIAMTFSFIILAAITNLFLAV